MIDRTIKHATLVTFALVALAPLTARAEPCTNDYDGWGWFEAAETMDNTLTAYWCNVDAQANADHYWASLRLGEVGDYWVNQAAQEGGLNCGNSNTHLIRLYNAAALMDAVYAHLNNTTLPLQGTWAYNWLAAFVNPRSIHGYTATCECCTAVAGNPLDDSATRLHYPFFWKRRVPRRASSLVHEATHEDKGHRPDDTCPARASCDAAYGDYNAQTMQINFLDHAVRAYQKDTSHELKVANYGGGRCGYLPLASPAARLHAAGDINTKVHNHFEEEREGPPGGTYHVSEEDELGDYGGYAWLVDELEHAFWRCDDLCNPADYLPGGARACNEDFQPGNAAVNQANYAKCAELQANVAAGVTSAQWHEAQFILANTVQRCVPGVSEEYLAQYCSGLSAGATNVGQIEAAWDLPDDPGFFDSGAELSGCLRSYCDQKFDPSWIAPARAACYAWDEPGYGCLAALCGDLSALEASYGATSIEVFLALQCRRHYVENDGNTFAYFTEQEAGDRCVLAYVGCKNEQAYADWIAAQAAGGCNLATQTATGGWAPSGVAEYHVAAARLVGSFVDFAGYKQLFESVPVDECMAVLNMCEASRELAAKIAASVVAGSKIPYPIKKLDDLPNASPWERYRSPVEQNMRGLAEIARSGATAGGITATQAARRLARGPEMQHALSLALGKQTFFAGFGTRDLEPVFGATALNRYAAAEVKIDASAEPAVKEALTGLASFKKTRERCESSTTFDALSAAAAKLTQAQFFAIVKALANAQSAADLEAALDQAAAP